MALKSHGAGIWTVRIGERCLRILEQAMEMIFANDGMRPTPKLYYPVMQHLTSLQDRPELPAQNLLEPTQKIETRQSSFPPISQSYIPLIACISLWVILLRFLPSMASSSTALQDFRKPTTQWTRSRSSRQTQIQPPPDADDACIHMQNELHAYLLMQFVVGWVPHIPQPTCCLHQGH